MARDVEDVAPELEKYLHGIRLADLPLDLRTRLQRFDKNGNGIIDPEELPIPENDKIAIKAFPTLVQQDLAVFDADGDGTVGMRELQRAAELYRISNNSVARLTKISLALVFALMAVMGCIAGLTYGIVEAAKEARTETVSTSNGEKVSTSFSTHNSSQLVKGSCVSDGRDLTVGVDQKNQAKLTEEMKANLIPLEETGSNSAPDSMSALSTVEGEYVFKFEKPAPANEMASFCSALGSGDRRFTGECMGEADTATAAQTVKISRAEIEKFRIAVRDDAKCKSSGAKCTNKFKITGIEQVKTVGTTRHWVVPDHHFDEPMHRRRLHMLDDYMFSTEIGKAHARRRLAELSTEDSPEGRAHRRALLQFDVDGKDVLGDMPKQHHVAYSYLDSKGPQYVVDKPNWNYGLDMIDQSSGVYNYQGGPISPNAYRNVLCGKGVTVFVFDTGVRKTHAEFLDADGNTRVVHSKVRCGTLMLIALDNGPSDLTQTHKLDTQGFYQRRWDAA